MVNKKTSAIIDVNFEWDELDQICKIEKFYLIKIYSIFRYNRRKKSVYFWNFKNF